MSHQQLQREIMTGHHFEDRSSDSTFRDSRSQSQDNPEPPDLPTPTCFRSRSHSYLRAIQAGCSQDDDTASMDSESPPPTATTVRTYSASTGEWPKGIHNIFSLGGFGKNHAPLVATAPTIG